MKKSFLECKNTMEESSELSRLIRDGLLKRMKRKIVMRSILYFVAVTAVLLLVSFLLMPADLTVYKLEEQIIRRETDGFFGVQGGANHLWAAALHPLRSVLPVLACMSILFTMIIAWSFPGVFNRSEGQS